MSVNLIDIEGDITPPRSEQVPKVRYLAYGSSITHGSHGIIPTNTYAAHTARLLNADLINLGFAGAAKLESGVADYIATRDDWNFATLEMGINILWIDPEEYRRRVEYFVKTIAKAHPQKKIFCIDVFYCYSDVYNDGKAAKFREIMKETIEKLRLSNVVYVNGLSVLDGSYGLASDIVHLNNISTSYVGQRLASIIKNHCRDMIFL